MNFNIVYSDAPSRKSGFITVDGKFINLQENKVQLIGYQSREVTHSDFTNYLHKQGISTRTLNLIRLNDGAYIYIAEEAYITLPEKEPSKKQYDAILKWLDFLSLNSKKKYVSIGINNRANKYEFFSKNNSDGLLPEQIVQEIKRMYAEANQEQ